MVAVTGDDYAQAISPWGAWWAGAPAAGRPRLGFRGYQGEGRDRLLAARVEGLLTREGAGWVGNEQAAGRVLGVSR